MEDMIFVDEILNERKIIINSPLVDVVENDLDRAATLTRYVFFFKLNSFQPFALTDQKVADSLRISVKKIERAKAWLKEHDFISVKRVGIPAVGYITVNISKVKELYRLMESSSPYSGNWNPVFGEHIYNIPERNILESNKENTKRSFETEKNIPVNGTPSSPIVDESHLAEEVFENSFWVLVPNKVGKEKAKKLFFRITNNCKSEKKVNEVVEGYKRYLSFLAKNKDNNFNRRPKDPATFLNVENKLWLESWEFNEEAVAVSAGGSRIKQPKNWQDRIGIAKNLGLLDDFEPEEIREMYKAWKYIPREAKEAIASEEVDNRIKQIEEYRKAEKERQQKEAAEQKRQKIDRLVRDYEEEYQSFKDVLSFDYENLEDALKHGENILYGVIEKILEHEKQLERKEAEQKRQEEEAKAREEEAKRKREREIRAEKFRKAYRAMFDWAESNCDLTEFVQEYADKIEKLKSFFDEELSLSEMLSCQNMEDKFLNVVVFLRMKLDDFINQGEYKDAYKVQKNIFRKAIA